MERRSELFLPGLRITRHIFLLLVAVFIGVTTGCSGGGSPSNGTAQPSNLSYPQATISATVGQAITTDMPTVTGTVTSFSVSPALPAGLTLNATNGAISGTLTAASSQATYTVTASNSAGSTTTAVQITVNAAVVPPSGLTYPQTTITAIAGQAITADTPTVTGTASSFAASPTLPAGLTLNTSNGTISGTPTAASAQATYTITASNSGGSTTATLQILVNAAIPAPSNLTYPQTTIEAITGQAITTDIPTVTGAVSSFSVSPALPAGLTPNTSNGAISGTPSAVAAQATYTVSATNATGSTTAALVITVSQAPTTLLDLGHANSILTLKSTTTRLLSQDYNGHWVLWDDTTSAEIASGDQMTGQMFGTSQPAWAVDLAGPIIAVGLANGLELRSSVDGQLQATIVSAMIDPPLPLGITAWWKLASDGSYVAAGSSNGLTIWNTTGQPILSRSGNYSAARVIAAPGQLQIALGAAGQNVIETISTVSGTSSIGPAFSGNFYTWFFDGQRFLTNLNTTVWTYSAASVQQALVSLPSIENLSAYGNWLYTYVSDGTFISGPIVFYPIGGHAPSATINIPAGSAIVPAANTLGIPSYGVPSTSVIDLSAATPVKTDYVLPIASGTAYTANSASSWTIGNGHGVILDGASLQTTARYFGSGQAWSIAGGSNYFAIATAIGTISYYSSATSTLVNTINFSSSQLALSSDGSVLTAFANTTDYQYQPDRTLNIYSLPSGSLINSFPAQYSINNNPYPFNFTLSADGSTLGEQIISASVGTVNYSLQVVPAAGGAVIWSENSPNDTTNVLLSPDGSTFAVSDSQSLPTASASIFTGSQIITAVPGVGIGWIDSDRFLTNLFVGQGRANPVYSGSAIYDKTGAPLSNPALPQLSNASLLPQAPINLLPVSSNSIYSPRFNTIYSLTTGSPIWTSPLPTTGVGAVAGNNVIFASGSRIVTSTY